MPSRKQRWAASKGVIACSPQRTALALTGATSKAKSILSLLTNARSLLGEGDMKTAHNALEDAKDQIAQLTKDINIAFDSLGADLD